MANENEMGFTGIGKLYLPLDVQSVLRLRTIVQIHIDTTVDFQTETEAMLLGEVKESIDTAIREHIEKPNHKMVRTEMVIAAILENMGGIENGIKVERDAMDRYEITQFNGSEDTIIFMGPLDMALEYSIRIRIEDEKENGSQSGLNLTTRGERG